MEINVTTLFDCFEPDTLAKIVADLTRGARINPMFPGWRHVVQLATDAMVIQVSETPAEQMIAAELKK